MDDPKARLKKNIKKIVLIFAVLIIAWLTATTVYSFTFHLVSTDPATGDVSTVTPNIKLNFNSFLVSKDLSVNVSPSMSTTTTISGKSLIVSLPSPMETTIKYKITVHYLENASNNVIKNLIIYFNPKLVSFNSLPKSTQKSILKQQDQGASNQQPSFSGTSGLINLGLSTEQVQDFEQGVTKYADANNIKFTAVTVLDSSLKTAPNSGNGIFGVNFTFSLGSQSYSASMQYTGIQSAQLTIYNSQGTQLYQYGNVSSSTGSTTSGSATSN